MSELLSILIGMALIDIDRLGLPKTPAPTLDTFMGILNVVFMITGALATIFIVVGALRFVISAGNPEGIERARGTITYAVVGLVVSVFAFAIVNFVISSL